MESTEIEQDLQNSILKSIIWNYRLLIIFSQHNIISSLTSCTKYEVSSCGSFRPEKTETDCCQEE